MKEVKIESKLFVFESLAELPSDVYDLMINAVTARNRAYAPYSNFQVGAALLLDNGEVITGNNQENASYPSGLCAERTAIYYAGSQYPNAKVVSMAITATAKTSPTNKPIPPCGACRQAMVEYELKQDLPIAIYFMGEMGAIAKSESVSNLLPFVFDKSVLF
ncbi:cytidine deaminase [Tamlana agarivorans]|uniref:Cytidine deaminase n=1 Tax=Pseudotamlana agarivorans TaxID=481183 RepID=A0ACC5U5K8_9FLAO|nr:cytidine deaminase [Tamlana agarivorans]MBU2949538.1 cytidine deaminase [Tamlana agarivorans]